MLRSAGAGTGRGEVKHAEERRKREDERRKILTGMGLDALQEDDLVGDIRDPLQLGSKIWRKIRRACQVRLYY